jgi:hypothetical protein
MKTILITYSIIKILLLDLFSKVYLKISVHLIHQNGCSMLQIASAASSVFSQFVWPCQQHRYLSWDTDFFKGGIQKAIKNPMVVSYCEYERFVS